MENIQQYDYDYLIKVSIIGDRGTGKTCLSERIVNDQFMSTYLPPTGLDFKTKFYSFETKKIRTCFWEICYSNRYCPTGIEVKGSSIILFIFDLTNSESFESLKYYYNRFCQQFPLLPPIFCVGTKSDLPPTVSERQILKQLKKMNYPPLYYCSSQTGSACKDIESDIIKVLSNIIKLQYQLSYRDDLPPSPSQHQPNPHSCSSKKCCLS
ncbi:Ras family protein [Entamoeba histolytica HM-1:IMSS-B]|uniref:Small GTPase EhRabX8 n=7 Tax=Entamoeba histolytica TaxID=5759 RepID=A0A8U0WPD0_ENTH1|eukprot:XP_651495.1 hypothetical protein EHI_178040 [Entamoeba histolytica HM-1:IMSS]